MLEYNIQVNNGNEALGTTGKTLTVNEAPRLVSLDFLVQDKISTLQNENQSLKLAASQAAQNNYIIGQLRPAPVPAYNVPNPYCCNTGCGCGGYGYGAGYNG